MPKTAKQRVTMRFLIPAFLLLQAQHADAWHDTEGPVHKHRHKHRHQHRGAAVEINAVGDAMDMQTLASEQRIGHGTITATAHHKLVRSEAAAPAPAASVENTVLTMKAEQADTGAGQQVLNKLKKDVDKLEKTERTEESLSDQITGGSGATGSFEEADGSPPSGDAPSPPSSPSPSPASPTPTGSSPKDALTTVSKIDELEKSEVEQDVKSLKGTLKQAEEDSSVNNEYSHQAQNQDGRLQNVG